MNGRERVLELVGQPGRHLAQVRETFLKLHSLPEVQHFGDVGHQAKRPLDVMKRVGHGRDAQPQVAQRAVGVDHVGLFAPE